MQVTTLNKIINLFLVGTFAALSIIILAAHILKDTISQSELTSIKSATETVGAPTMIVTATFVILSVGIMLGIITDAISNLIFNRLVKFALKIKFIRILFSCNRLYLQNQLLLEKFQQTFASVDKYENLNKEQSVTKAYATAIFFDTANKENIEWAIQHYSVYLLALNYLFILTLAFLIISILSITTFWKLIILSIIFLGMYALFFQALHKYLYTYEVTYRHGSIVLSRENAEQKEIAVNQKSSSVSKGNQKKIS